MFLASLWTQFPGVSQNPNICINLLSRKYPILQLCGTSMGSTDTPVLSSSTPRDSSSLAGGSCMDMPLLAASRRTGGALLVVQRAPPGAGAQAAPCRVLLKRAGKEHPSAVMETQGTRGLAMVHSQKDPTSISPKSKSLRCSCVRLNTWVVYRKYTRYYTPQQLTQKSHQD